MIGLLFLGFCVAFYFLPALLGRHKRNWAAIFVLNLLLGWTLIGWVVALVWALTVDNRIAPVPQAWGCAGCGSRLNHGESFCRSCGSRIGWPSSQATLRY